MIIHYGGSQMPNSVSAGAAQSLSEPGELAGRIVLEKLAKFNQHYRLAIGRVAIKNHRSRWGSCSRRGNLNFNYRLAWLPERLIEYIVAHELCHLREFNHSKKFWALVAQTIPDHKALRRELREHR